MIARTLMISVAMLGTAGIALNPAIAQEQQTQQGQETLAPTDPSMFTALAASGNLFEIESSQNALDRVQSQEVRDFAQMMVEDHQAALEHLEQAAAEEGWEMPSEMGRTHRQKFETLSGENAENFEAEYVRAQVQAHNEAVSLYQNYVADAPAGALRTFAQETLPVLQQHQQRIYEISEAMGEADQAANPSAATDDQRQAQADSDARTDPPDQAMAGTCQTELTDFANRLGEDQFWVTGWGNRWGTGAVDPADTNTALMPWNGADTDRRSPRTQIRQLFGAAHVLAYQGHSEGCQYLLDVLDQTYQDYTARLTDAGISPENVTGWRQEQLALAQPVSDLSEMGRLNADDLTGTDVRNLQDEALGSVSDLILDPDTGALTYVVVARGGFLGFGEDYIAVPWSRFSATAGLNTLVLDMSPEALQDAPAIDPESFGDPSTYGEQDQRIGEFWNM